VFAHSADRVKGDLGLRPIFHEDEQRVEAHRAQRRLHALAPELGPRSVLRSSPACR
jgi:hypothetical protein